MPFVVFSPEKRLLPPVEFYGNIASLFFLYWGRELCPVEMHLRG